MPFSPGFLSLRDLCHAYRKAKWEAFRDTNCAHGRKFAAFERHFEVNIRDLHRRLISRRPSWFFELDYLGRATCIAKSVTPNPIPGSHFRLTNPKEEWVRNHPSTKKADADFRPVVDATVEFQVISALWILKVGHLYDARLDPRVAVGNRVKRWRAADDLPASAVGELNEKSHALFHAYYFAYGAWRENGLNAMKSELSAGKHIVAVTMDLRKFYHRVDASFLLHPSYLRALGINPSADQNLLTKHLIGAIGTWNRAAKKLTGVEQWGLPVGLTASGVIANVLLKEFDTAVQAMRPAYYGRYVDDIFLVLRHPGFRSSNELMRWLQRKLDPIAQYSEADDAERSPILHVRLPYGGRSDLCFMGSKQKVFQLEGTHGLDLITPIEEQIRRQRSEHREMPDLPNTEGEMAARALLVSEDATLDADALRKADAVTLRRAGFAMLLRTIEHHAHHVDRSSWKDLRRQFYGLAERHLLTPKGFFDYERYIPRVLGVMMACRDRNRASTFVRYIAELLDIIAKTCRCRSTVLSACRRNLARRMVESVLQAPSVERREMEIAPLIQLIERKIARKRSVVPGEPAIRRTAKRLFLADWARRPYGPAWLESQAAKSGTVTKPADADVREAIGYAEFRRVRKMAKISEPFHWPALAFPTRPIAVPDLTAYAPHLLSDYDSLADSIRTLRGTWMPRASNLRVKPIEDGSPAYLYIPRAKRRPVIVAVANYKTDPEEWKAAALGKPKHGLERYRRMNRLLNGVLKLSPRPDYLLLPECSMPRRWARYVAGKLSLHGVSLIAGLEYVKGKTGLRNEAIVSLHSDFPGYLQNVVLLQPKLCAAWREGTDLQRLARCSLEPPGSGAFSLPVYVHGRFQFAVLICSDLTTLGNRRLLQGHVDCLFVPEWNPDLETFGTLVEASTHDLAAYVVQANNRLYGDSRIRAPFKVGFMRDVVRVKGGLHDYFVAEQIDVTALRAYLSHPVPPDGEDAKFKPFPIGYPLAPGRRVTQ